MEGKGSKHDDYNGDLSVPSSTDTDGEDNIGSTHSETATVDKWRLFPKRKMIALVVMGVITSALLGVALYYRHQKENTSSAQDPATLSTNEDLPWYHDCGTGSIRMYPLRPLLNLSSYAAPDPTILPIFTQEAIQANASSPQALAWNWIQRHPDFPDMPDWRKQQRMAMATLQFACDPFFPDGHHNQICFSPTDECFHPWYGYGFREDHPQGMCNEDGVLTNLDFSDLEFMGTLPAEISLLTALTTLRLSDNYLTGQLPTELGLLSSLEDMSFFVNDLKGTLVTELGLLTKLTRLWFGDNVGIEGPVPTELGRLTALEDLSLDYTSLTGSIPSEFGKLTALKSLVFSNSELTGTIPEELVSLTALIDLRLSQNNLSGSISEELSQQWSTRLKTVCLTAGNDNLQGNLPEDSC